MCVGVFQRMALLSFYLLSTLKYQSMFKIYCFNFYRGLLFKNINPEDFHGCHGCPNNVRLFGYLTYQVCEF